jgi:hypothetical protein
MSHGSEEPRLRFYGVSEEITGAARSAPPFATGALFTGCTIVAMPDAGLPPLQEASSADSSRVGSHNLTRKVGFNRAAIPKVFAVPPAVKVSCAVHLATA